MISNTSRHSWSLILVFFVFIHYFLSQTKMRFGEMVIGELDPGVCLVAVAFRGSGKFPRSRNDPPLETVAASGRGCRPPPRILGLPTVRPHRSCAWYKGCSAQWRGRIAENSNYTTTYRENAFSSSGMAEPAMNGWKVIR